MYYEKMLQFRENGIIFDKKRLIKKVNTQGIMSKYQQVTITE